MASNKSLVPLSGSERELVAGARCVGAPNPGETVDVTVLVRSRSVQPALPSLDELSSPAAQDRRPLTRDEFHQMHGADPQDLGKIEAFAHDHGLTVKEVSVARRSVVLCGTVAALSSAFGVYLACYEHQGVTFRGRSGAIHVPADLADIIEGVFGLDDRPQAHPHFRRSESRPGIANPHATGPTFTPVELAKLYDFPIGVTGQGQTIALIELGGGYRPDDLNVYFREIGVSPAPQVVAVSVDGAINNPTTANSADGEVALDIEVAGAIAPGAQIAVYFAPNTDRGFLDAITTAIHDTLRKPAVISISWGNPEARWTKQSMRAFDQAFQAAAAMGVSVCAASGDSGSSDGINDGRAHVDFPASSPFALACGGTRLQASGTSITSETVWNGNGATGGGISDVFPPPAYQRTANVPPSVNRGARKGRGVPDVAGDADPNTGYKVRVDGSEMVIGGTSAVAPLWAGLIALMNQRLARPVGFLQPALYQRAAAARIMNDITAGDNGQYRARSGWDACTGLGSPDGSKLLNALLGTA